MYCYSNNGLSMRAVDADYEALSGEAVFNEIPTVSQLYSAFPLYSAKVEKQGVIQQIAELEALMTDRMMREAITGAAATFSSGEFSGMTSRQALASIQSQIMALREEL